MVLSDEHTLTAFRFIRKKLILAGYRYNFVKIIRMREVGTWLKQRLIYANSLLLSLLSE